MLEVTEEEINVSPARPARPGLELYQLAHLAAGLLIEALLGGSDEIWQAAQDYR